MASPDAPVSESAHARPEPAREQTASATHLPYLPGLDGLRAVSVLAVLVYHYRPDRSLLPGGFLGVEVFFVISGYLITSLLLAESRATYRVDLGHFWMRRIRRLWPALIAMMLVTSFVVAVFYHEELGRLRGDIAFGFYAENWWHIVHGVSYVEQAADAGARQPFQHLWSLAVEEQFYLIWPLLFVLGRWFGLQRLRVSTIVLAICSWMAMVWLALHSNLNHAYLGTEARAFGLLCGCLLAFAYPPRRRSRSVGPRASSILDGAGVVAALGLIALFVFARQTSTWLYIVGFPLTDLFSIVLITVIVSPDATVGRVLGSKPLQVVGLRSYGIYLWGIAIFEFTRPGLDLHGSALGILLLRLVLVFVVVEVSYRFIETPVRTGAFARSWRSMRTGTGEPRLMLQRRWRTGIAFVAMLTLFVATAAVLATPPDDLQIVGGRTASGGGDCVATAKCAVPTAPTTSTAGGVPTTSQATKTTRAPLINTGGWKVSAVGDSVLLGASLPLEHTLSAATGGGVLVNAAVSRHAGTCLQVIQTLVAQGRLAPLVIVHCGNNGALGAGFVSQVMNLVGPHRKVMFVSLKVPRSWQDSDNAQLANDVKPYKTARIFDWHNLGTLLTPQDAYFYKDGYHLRPVGRAYYASHVLKVLKIWNWL